MPKKTQLKGPFKNIQLKLYGEDVKRYGELFWTAQDRANARRKKIVATQLNEALLSLPGALDWLVTEDELLYFRGKLKKKPKTLVELTPAQLEDLYTGGPAEPEGGRLVSKKLNSQHGSDAVAAASNQTPGGGQRSGKR